MMSILPNAISERTAANGPVKVRFWGVRGGIPTPGPQTVRFGGNTSCVEVRADGELIILDAGSGLRPLGAALCSEFPDGSKDLTVLVTHAHCDHIQGFPFFAPAHDSRNRVRVLGFEEGCLGIRKAMTVQMEAPPFPVPLTWMREHVGFDELRGDAPRIGSIRLEACRTNHPGVCHGFRLETSAGGICYIPDHEATGDDNAPDTAAVARLLRDAEVAILDAQYTAEEYREHQGWGHSSVDDAVRLALEARVKRLFLFHHDPSHDDEFLNRMLHRARRIAIGRGTRVEAAREGEQVLLGVKV